MHKVDIQVLHKNINTFHIHPENGDPTPTHSLRTLSWSSHWKLGKILLFSFFSPPPPLYFQLVGKAREVGFVQTYFIVIPLQKDQTQVLKTYNVLSLNTWEKLRMECKKLCFNCITFYKIITVFTAIQTVEAFSKASGT